MNRTVLASIGLAAAVGPSARADGPSAAFAVADGFLTVHVTRPGGPPGPCRVRAVTPAGHVWAEGPTDDDGRCEFPRPRGDTCRVEIDLGGTPTPPVELTFVDGGTAVVPLVAPLTPGPCCRRHPDPDPDPDTAGGPEPPAGGWQPALVSLSAVFLFLGLALWAATRPAGRPARRAPR